MTKETTGEHMGRILVVDDSTANLQLLTNLLSEHGYTVHPASDGELALEFVQAILPDLILLDIKMPGMDGYEVCRRLKADERTRPIPIIFISVLEDERCKVRGLQAGGVDYINKPFHADEVLARVNTHLTLRHMQLDLERSNAELRTARDTLEERVRERSTELEQANRKLRQEIHEHRRTLEVLQESEERFRSLALVAPVGIFRLDAAGRLIFTNDRWRQMVGLFPGDPSIDEWSKVLHRDDEARVMKAWHDAEAFHETFRAEYRVTGPDGGVIWVIGEAVPERDENGVICGYMGTLTDITERKRAEQTVQESERRFHQMLENLRLVAVMLDTRGTVTFCNKALLDLTGWERAEVIGESWFAKFLPPEARNSLEPIFFERMPRGDFPPYYENEIVTRQGEARLIGWSNVVLWDLQGNVVGGTGIGEDITERRRIESQLKQAEKMEVVGTLAGGIAHDFNNILGAVMGYADMARNDAPAGSEIRGYLEEVLKAAERAKELTKQILVFSRKGESEPGREWSGVQISLVVKEALKLLRATLPSTIEIRQHFTAPPNSLVMADPIQIHQVLMNLCTNAGYAMRETGGVLEVGLAEVDLDHHAAGASPDLGPGRYLKLTVSDTGLGMDRATMEKIFDPFFTTKPHGEGTGMGLSVAHGIVKSHGGAITVQSEPRKGSVFHVYLPKSEQAAPPSPTEDADIPTGKERILLVDDEKAMAEVGRHILERLGYQVVAMTSSVDALDVFAAHPYEFDLIITDYTMPRMTGTVLAGEIRGIRPDIPIIMCTGFSEMITKEKAEGMGIQAFLMKPLTPRQMAGIVSDVLKGSVKGSSVKG